MASCRQENKRADDRRKVTVAPGHDALIVLSAPFGSPPRDFNGKEREFPNPVFAGVSFAEFVIAPGRTVREVHTLNVQCDAAQFVRSLKVGIPRGSCGLPRSDQGILSVGSLLGFSGGDRVLEILNPE